MASVIYIKLFAVAGSFYDGINIICDRLLSKYYQLNLLYHKTYTDNVNSVRNEEETGRRSR